MYIPTELPEKTNKQSRHNVRMRRNKVNDSRAINSAPDRPERLADAALFRVVDGLLSVVFAVVLDVAVVVVVFDVAVVAVVALRAGLVATGTA